MVGAFGFFRKYQKLILYTAGIFALITFSITGAMTDFFRNLTARDIGEPDTITVAGVKHQITVEDVMIGGLLERYIGNLPSVLPAAALGDGSTSDLSTCLAILRRASIAEGLEVSMDEADRAIAWDTRALNEVRNSSDTPAQMALRRRFDGLAQYRQLTAEAMRIGNYVLLQSAGADVSDAMLIQYLLRNREKMTAKVATFDMKALEEEMKASSPVDEAGLRAWLDEKDEAAKGRLAIYDTNRVSLAAATIRFADFDSAEWEKELEGFTVEDARRQQLYKLERETRFKTTNEETDEVTYREFDDEGVAEELNRLAQVEHVLQGMLTKLRQQSNEAIKDANEAYMTAMNERMTSDQDLQKAKQNLEDNPDDEAVKTAHRDAENIQIAKQNAENEAKDALNAARAAFDFKAAFEALASVEGGGLRKGVAMVVVDGLKNADELKDLTDVSLGEWSNPYLATMHSEKGALSSTPARSSDAGFLFQVTDVQVRPMKKWEDLEESLTEAYYIEKAKATGEEQKTKLEEALQRLAKEQIPDEIAEIEAKRQAQIEERFNEWETSCTEGLDKADRMLSEIDEGSRAYLSWQAKRDQLVAEMADKEGKRTKIAEEVGETLDEEIREAAKARYVDVVDQAVAETEFQLATLGPYKRKENQSPYFRQRSEPTVAFLWGGRINDLDAGKASDVLEDTAERRWQFAVVTEVEPLGIEDITRREFAVNRRMFAPSQVSSAMQQSFTLDALSKRYQLERNRGQQVVDTTENAKTDAEK